MSQHFSAKDPHSKIKEKDLKKNRIKFQRTSVRRYTNEPFFKKQQHGNNFNIEMLLLKIQNKFIQKISSSVALTKEKHELYHTKHTQLS